MTGGAGVVMWLIIAVVLFVIEGLTVQVVCMWFAFGSLFAALTSLASGPFWLQLLVFLVSSILVLIIGRPLLMDKLVKRKVPTNADRVIGQVGVVIQTINNLEQQGRVLVDGLDWSARSEDNQPIAENVKVVVRFIEGVKLIVLPLEKLMPQEPPTDAQAKDAATEQREEQ